MSGQGQVPAPSDEQLRSMNREQLGRLGTQLDDVQLVEWGERYIPGSPADKRAERKVARWFLLAALFGLAFVVVFIWWPATYRTAASGEQLMYALYTPMIGLTLGLSILCFGIGIIAIARRIAPHEVAVQQRHEGMSAEVDRQTLAAEVMDTLDKSGVKRRGMLKGTLALGGAGLGLAAVVPILGGLIKNPWAKGPKSDLWVTGWAPVNGERVRLTQVDGTPVRPSDMAAGSMMTVFPGLPGGAKMSDSAVMLIRLRPNDVVRVRAGQQGWQYGDYYAFSKICTHVGCPTSLYEQQTGRILCPCHQSQFDVYDGCRPVFGPATRPLPQLPITVDDEGFFIAVSDFHEAVGPGFWENGKQPQWKSEPKEEA
ncbi:ubiquinol-cytochrome c reductase iron-sulfur subunit [Nakamurella aerolata]|uniref:Cytochrome bc1 complex Rieske iron-sulfur subunit n=1 Tax=Nakamurella aerolata TaxID=1656892 RepID=A0A849A232_9ACTN|nr:Rieske 2Fe-2S domain-containing protein [Nakamurella aerolata]NNG34669.1 Rieske 2Fe-2S domain-containing protein [Nakamurella aerolata]